MPTPCYDIDAGARDYAGTHLRSFCLPGHAEHFERRAGQKFAAGRRREEESFLQIVGSLVNRISCPEYDSEQIKLGAVLGATVPSGGVHGRISPCMQGIIHDEDAVNIERAFEDAIAPNQKEIEVFLDFEGAYLRLTHNHVRIAAIALLFRLDVAEGARDREPAWETTEWPLHI